MYLNRIGALLLLSAAACGSSESPADSGTSFPDAAPIVDSGITVDAGFADAQVGDMGQANPDAAIPDVGMADAGSPDSSTPDMGSSTSSITFTEHVWPVMEASGCARFECHGGVNAIGGMALTLSDPAFALVELSRRSFLTGRMIVEPGNPEQSELYIHGRDANIPTGDLTNAGLKVFGDWIRAGAPAGPERTRPQPAEPATCAMDNYFGLPNLPSACLPRCTSSTFQQMVACRQSPNSAECQTMAFAADPTPAITMTLGPLTEAVQLDCSACPNWQTFACAFQSCPAATAAYLRCTSGSVPSNDNCAAITATMASCFMRQAVISCREVNTPRCFAP